MNLQVKKLFYKPSMNLLLLALAWLASFFATAHDFKVGDIEIQHPWVAPTIASSRVTGVYFTVKNLGKTPDKLIRIEVSDEVADAASLHELREVDGLLRMRPLSNGKQIDPGKSVQFKQGGDHGMLMGLKAPLLIGDKFEASLVFENAGTVNVEFWAESGPESSGSHANHL